MKNSHLKNSLIAAGIAVFAGVVTLGASVAIGATPAPTQDPTTANGVGPTFTSVTVGGNTTIGGILDVAGAIKNTVGGILQINSPGGLDINAQIRNDTVANAPVMFNDANGVALKAGDLDIQGGSIKNTSNLNVGYVVVNDALMSLSLWTGAALFSDNVNMSKALTLAADQWLTVDKITSTSPGTGKAIMFNTPIQGLGGQDLQVKSGVNATDLITSAVGIWSKGYATIFGDLQLGNIGQVTNPIINTQTGMISIRNLSSGATLDIGNGTIDSSINPINVKKTLDVKGGLVNTSTTAFGGVSVGNPVAIIDDLSVNGKSAFTDVIYGNNANDITFGDTKVNANVNVNGKLVVNSNAGTNSVVNIFGPNGNGQTSTINLMDTNNYLQSIWGGNTVLRSWNGINLQVNHSTAGMTINTAGKVTSTGGFGTSTQYSSSGTGVAVSSCPSATEILLSCSGAATAPASLGQIVPTGTSCVVTSPSNVKVYAYAICLDYAK